MEEVGVFIYLYTVIKQLNNKHLHSNCQKEALRNKWKHHFKNHFAFTSDNNVAYKYNYTKKENIYTDNVNITYIKEAICFPTVVRFSSRGAALIARGTSGNKYWLQITRNNFLDSKTSFRAICVF